MDLLGLDVECVGGSGSQCEQREKEAGDEGQLRQDAMPPAAGTKTAPKHSNMPLSSQLAAS
jgi:hypothetical protein